MKIQEATHADLPEILHLQRLAFLSEAEGLHKLDIPPMVQTLEEKEREYERGLILKLQAADGRIIGSVCGTLLENGTLCIGKLMVHPAYRRKGYATLLLDEIQARIPHVRCELFTSTQSVSNISLYERNGFVRYKEEALGTLLMLVYMEKRY